MIPENEDILLSILHSIKKPCETVEDEKINYYLNNCYFYPNGATPEGFDSEDGLVKVNLIHNIKYNCRKTDMDWDTPIFRIFTVKTSDNCRYFTSCGTDYELGFVVEHSKDGFVKLLDEHLDLQDNSAIKNLRTIILHDELQENMEIQSITKPKPKL